MIRCIYLICVACFLLSACCSQSNRAYFTINPEDRKMVFPVQLNDSVTAKLIFDTGAQLGKIVLDSTFCSVHSVIGNVPSSDTLYGGSLWAENSVSTLRYNVNTTVYMAGQTLIYNDVDVFDWKGHLFTSDSNGLFNIPENDSTHIWEFNFENNYLEIYNDKDFQMPDDCFIAPIVRNEHHSFPFNVRLPIKVRCSNGDTLTLDRTFLIDTGMAWDIVLTRKENIDAEYDFFNNRDDAVWTSYLSHYHRYCTVDATLFDKLKMDSLRIYTFDYPNDMKFDYIIGQNFLKRFNVFFDMKHRALGLQPIKNYQRIINPVQQRFHFSYGFTHQGKMMVTGIGEYDSNRFKKAGLKKGDEIVFINNRPAKDFDWLEHRALEVEADTIVYDAIRNGDSLKIVVPIDKNEIQGD